MKVKIREAGIQDLEAIVSNNIAMALESEGKRLSREKVEEGARKVLEGQVDARYFVAEVDGTVVCQLMITKEWSDWRAGYFWWIQSVYTLPEWRRKGLFKLLYSFIVEKAKQEGACGIRLYVEENNRQAMEVYRKLGMKLTGYRIYELEF